MSSIFFRLLILSFFLSTANADENLVLGQFSGDSLMYVSTRTQGNEIAYSKRCTVSMNISITDQSISMPYSLYQCSGFSAWNEHPVSLGIENNKIYQGEKPVGQVLPDGTYEFQLEQWSVLQESVPQAGQYCHILHYVEKEFQLKSLIKYRIKKLSETAYSLNQEWDAEVLQAIYKKDNPACQSYKDFEINKEYRQISVDLN